MERQVRCANCTWSCELNPGKVPTKRTTAHRRHMATEMTASGFASTVRFNWNLAGSPSSRRFPPHPLWLRDVCDCPQCVDPSTGQKRFQTCDLPLNIEAKILEETDDVIRITWKNDLATVGPEHISVYQQSKLSAYLSSSENEGDVVGAGWSMPIARMWDGAAMTQNLLSVDFASYQKSEYALLKVLEHLKRCGLVLITNAPPREDAVESVAGRIGHLRETFYGRTWDVKATPKAKNVAYTNQFLGFHMDLLYMSDPPGLQFLHCLKNSCSGGESMFADAFHAAHAVKENSKDDYHILSTFPQTFHYRNAGEHYRYTRPTIVEDENENIDHVNWSPPFQGAFEGRPSSSNLSHYVHAAKAFSSQVEAAKSIYEYRMREGDCFIFSNRRVLHARRAFDTASGERWLKGAYLDTDVFNSRLRVMLEKAFER